MNRRKWIIFGIALALIFGTGSLILVMKGRQHLGKPGLKVSPGESPGTLRVDLPEKVLDFKSVEADASIEKGSLPRDTTIAKRAYQAPDGSSILLTAVLMGTDRTSLHRPEICLKGQGWEINLDRTKITSVAMPLPVPHRMPVRKMVTAGFTQTPTGQKIPLRGLYVYWYVADGKVTADDRARMWSMGKELLRTGVLERWAYVSCFTACLPEDEDAAFQRLERFIAAAAPEFQVALGTDETSVFQQTALR